MTEEQLQEWKKSVSGKKVAHKSKTIVKKQKKVEQILPEEKVLTPNDISRLKLSYLSSSAEKNGPKENVTMDKIDAGLPSLAKKAKQVGEFGQSSQYQINPNYQ